MEYAVIWTIDIEADSPREAAEAALAIQRDPHSTALVFKVQATQPRWASRAGQYGRPHTVDLNAPEA